MRYKIRIATFLATSSAYLLCAATPAVRSNGASAPQAQQVRCEKELKDYSEAMRFVRQNAGDRIGDRVAAGYIDEAQLQRVAQTSGPCAAAQLLHDKRAMH
ncbi:MAG TPA: hypothetical protein VFV25_02570 [Methylibium sp.]